MPETSRVRRAVHLSRPLLVAELLLVLALSLGKSGVYALVDLIAAATAPGSLSGQAAVLNGSLAPGRVWLDLSLQLLAIGFGLVPVFLVAYLLVRSGTSPRALWFGRRRLRVDALAGTPSRGCGGLRPVSPSTC